MQFESFTDIRTARVFAPAHITGFFQIHDHEDPMKKGSTGCGVVLDGGVYTTVKAGKDIDRTEIYLNAEIVSGETSRTVVESITELPVKVESISDIPVGCGFGASGAGALGTAYALNHALSLEYTSVRLNDIAHVAEVKNGSGLGDVTGQAHGGIPIRKTPGAPSLAETDQIPTREKEVCCVVLGELPTSSVLSNPEMVENINISGEEAMKKLTEKPTIKNFMNCSRDFAIDSELATGKVRDVIEAADEIGFIASQAMLGNAVFSIPSITSVTSASELVDVFSEFGEVHRFRIRTGSIRIV
ncbi:pantoate kinase [Methanolobus bombayensis]|uniref:pantoate kinase n=1 Tax=Methanolobus bombayensis TaxID=38023 RepID=UPI001AE7D4A9|nr:pantoate kinase [Methanolobus bombayensis]MBP1909429.1 pantoate kinase [Methanolobus bombayensis]